MLTITIKITAQTFDEATMALDEIKKRLDEQYTSGYDECGQNRYSFDVQGEEEKVDGEL